MEVWQICNLGFVFGAAAGLAQLLSSKRALKTRNVIAVALNSGLSGLAAACIAVDTMDVHEPGKLVAIAVFSGFGGAPVVSRIMDIAHRVQLREPRKEFPDE